MKGSWVDFEKLKSWAYGERWTPSSIARKTGLSSAGVSKILTGEVDPAATNLKKVCDTIGLPIEQAFVEVEAA